MQKKSAADVLKTLSLTQIMRVKAWVRTDEDAESNSLHTLFSVPWMSLSRESPEEETQVSQQLLADKLKRSVFWGEGKKKKV